MFRYRSRPVLPAVVLLLAAVTVGPGPIAPPELAAATFLPGDAVLAPAAGKQMSPEIAAGGPGFLVVWVDDRTAITQNMVFGGGKAFDHHIGSMWDVYAARLDADGNLIDQTPIIVAQQIQHQGLIDVAWNGQNWLVVFSGEEGMQCCPQVRRFVARVSPAGVVLDDPPIRVDASFVNNWPPTLGSDGVTWLLVGVDQLPGGTYVIRGMRIGPDGTPLDPAGVVISSGGSPGDFDLVFAGGEYFLVWSDGGMTSGGRIKAQRLTRDLAPIGSPITVNPYNPTQGHNCRVATDGTDYFVAWFEDRYDYFAQVMGARVTRAGVVLDPNGLPLTAAFGTVQYEPVVGWDGINYVVVYYTYGEPPEDLYAARVTPAGRVLDYDQDRIPVSTAPRRQLEPAIDHAPGGRTVIAWRDDRHANEYWGDVYATTFAANGSVGADRCVALGAPRQTRPRLVPNGAGYLAVFRSETSPETRIAAQRVGADGAALDAEPVLVARGGSEIRNPSAAWSGVEYLVVWENSITHQTFGRRLAADLTFLDPGPVALLPGNWPDVAAEAGIFLVVTSYEQPREIRQIYSRRVRGADGAILDAAPRIVGPNFSRHPRVTSFAGRWLVAWQRHPTHDNPNTLIQANFVGVDGAPATYFTAGADGELPAVAAGPDLALIAWEDTDIGTSGLEIFVTRLRPDGSFLATTQVTTAANSQFDAAVAWTGDGFTVAYGDFRNDGALESHRGDLYATRLDRDGLVVEPAGSAVANDTIPEMFASVAANGADYLIAGSVFRQDPGYVAYRIALSAPFRTTGVADPDGAGRPLLVLSPNPLVGPATIRFRAVRGQPASVAVHDLAGRAVRRLFEGPAAGETVRLEWDLRDEAKRPVGAGIYFVTARTPEGRSVARAVVAR